MTCPLAIARGGHRAHHRNSRWRSWFRHHARAVGDIRSRAPVGASVVLASGATRITTAQKARPRSEESPPTARPIWFDELEEIDVGRPDGQRVEALEPKKCAALTRLSNEVVDDSDPSRDRQRRHRHDRAVALKVDRAILGGRRGQGTARACSPKRGSTSPARSPSTALIDAAGLIADVGGQGRASPTSTRPTSPRYRKEKDLQERPLLTPTFRVAREHGLWARRCGRTKGVAVGTALVAATRRKSSSRCDKDPTVAVSARRVVHERRRDLPA